MDDYSVGRAVFDLVLGIVLIGCSIWAIVDIVHRLG